MDNGTQVKQSNFQVEYKENKNNLSGVAVLTN